MRKPWNSARNALLWMGITVSQWAVAGQPPSADQIMAKTDKTDASISILKLVFGDDFVNNPLTAVGTSTNGSLLAAMFITFNILMFGVGMIWASYTVGSGIAQTAHEGEALGRRFSSLWMPVRMVTGAVGLVPVFGGFNAFQALMMFLGLVGIGTANWIWKEGVDTTSKGFVGVTQAGLIHPTSSAALSNVAVAMLASNVCAQTYKAYESINRAGGSGTDVVIREIPSEKGLGLVYGTATHNNLCGSWNVKLVNDIKNPDNNPGYRELKTTFNDYRITSVNYEEIRRVAERSKEIYERRVQEMNRSIQAMAVNWVNDRESKLEGDGSTSAVVKLTDLKKIVLNTEQAIHKDVMALTANNSAITQQASQRMKEIGWLGAGSWFSTFAEVNAALADAGRNMVVDVSMPDLDSSSMNSTAKESLAELRKQYSIAHAKLTGAQDPTKQGFAETSKEAINCAQLGTNSVGDCSLGQSIVEFAVGATATNSGGNGLINPIIMFKNIGDYVLGIASSVVVGGAMMALAPGWMTKVVSKASDVISSVGKATKKGDSEGSGLLGSITNGLSSVALLLLVAGIAMSVYMPFVPFIVWIGAAVTYFTVFIEGMMSAPIWAFTHLDANGEGMGQRTERGYVFTLNMLMRPALMIMSFFVASGLLIAIGTLLAKLFLPAIANVQGNSMTGIATVVGLLLVFFMMNVMLVHALFNLVYIIPDQVLGMIGGHNGVHLGRDADDRIRGMVYMAAGRVPGVRGSDTKGAGGGGGQAGGNARGAGQQGQSGGGDSKKPNNAGKA